jgi:hypothetical protein
LLPGYMLPSSALVMSDYFPFEKKRKKYPFYS